MSYAETRDTSTVKELDERMNALSESRQRMALNYLWGTMTVRDPHVCADALKFAEPKATDED